MIRDFDDLPDGTELQTDLCIVGAGAAGLLIARALEGSGLDVILVESGGELPDAAADALSDGQVGPGPFRGLREGRARALGGTTTRWGGQCIPLDPIDFEARSWVPESGWPITHAALAPHYIAAQRALGIDPEDAGRPAWERFRLAPLAFDPDRLRPVHGVFIRQANLGRRFRAQLAAARGVRVLLHATVQGVDTNGYGTQVAGVRLRSLRGHSGRVRARQVVLCAGAIENARLLLLSDAVHEHGLGNAYDQVGRHLQDHPCGCVASVETDTPRVLQDHWNMLYGWRARYLPKLALAEAAQRRLGVLNCVGRLAYEYDEAGGTRTLMALEAELRAGRMPPDLLRRTLAVGRGGREAAETLWRVGVRGLSPAPRPRRILLEAFTEQAPDPQSRVTLSRVTDPLGQRQVHVDWRLDALTGETLRRFTALAGAEFARLGLGRVQPAAWLSGPVPAGPAVVDSFHPAGTTRMALSPRRGVVDADCQVFGVAGLHVAGASVFPTSGAANPTLTIAAMALRLVERLKATAARGSPVAARQDPVRRVLTAAS